MPELESNRSKKGLFITIEGVEGAGKTTQARLLVDKIASCGFEVLLTREPGGTSIGEKIREILLNPSFSEMIPFCEVLLYNAARSQLVSQVIRPSLQKGMVVVSDRYFDSTTVYQGFAGGEDPEIIRKINLWSTGGLFPELTFVLDVDIMTGFGRLLQKRKRGAEENGDRVEQKELDFHHRVREGFLKLAQGEPERITVIQAGGKPEEVHAAIWTKVRAVLKEKRLQRGSGCFGL